MGDELCEHAGFRWRSSQTFTLVTVSVALYAESFLYGFLVPVLGYMLETRLDLDPSRTQNLTIALLSIHGLLALFSAPIIGALADKTSDRKTLLLISLLVCIVGTVMIAIASNVATIFGGRILQGLSGSATWIICFATLSANASQEEMGKFIGVAMSFVMAGVVTGPLVAGVLLESVGYWGMWSIPLIVLALDMIARAIMLENRVVTTVVHERTESAVASPFFSNNEDAVTAHDTEATTLLNSNQHDYGFTPSTARTSDPQKAESTPTGFYALMLRDIRVIISILNTISLTAVMAGFNTTLPLHLYRVFKWGPHEVGMMFLALQLPTIILGPLVGVLRNRIGLRTPTAVGWLLLAPLLLLLGLPGRNITSQTIPKSTDTFVLIACIIGIGSVSTLLRSAGALQITMVMHDKQAKFPEIFGEHGGYSRGFSIVEIAFNVGLIVGPLLSGLLSQKLGYYLMNAVLATLSLILAVLTSLFSD